MSVGRGYYRSPTSRGPARVAGSAVEPQLLYRGIFVIEDRRVVRQSHDLKRLVNDRREAAEGDLAAFVHHLLDDLDEDADADRIDDLRLAQVEQQRAHSVIHQLVRAVGDLFAADVVDVALRVKDRALRLPFDCD